MRGRSTHFDWSDRWEAVEPSSQEIDAPSIWEFRLTTRPPFGSDASVPPGPDPEPLDGERDLVLTWATPFPGAEEFWTTAELRRALEAAPDRPWRRIGERVTFPWPAEGSGATPRFAVKRQAFAAGLLSGLDKDPLALEFTALVSLQGQVSVPRPVLHVHSARLGRSALVMEEVLHRRSLRQAIAADPAPAARARAEAPRLAALVAGLHESGYHHRDLYLQHVVVREGDGELVLLDLGRAGRGIPPRFRRGRPWRPSWLPWVSGRHVRARWFQKDLAAIHVSAGEAYRDALLDALLPEYLRLRGLPSEAVDAWGRAVRRRSARMAARVPRVTDPETREGDAVEREVDGRFLSRS